MLHADHNLKAAYDQHVTTVARVETLKAQSDFGNDVISVLHLITQVYAPDERPRPLSVRRLRTNESETTLARGGGRTPMAAPTPGRLSG